MKKQFGIIASMMALLDSTTFVEEPMSGPVSKGYETPRKYGRNRQEPHAASTQRKRRKYARQNPHSRYAKHKRG